MALWIKILSQLNGLLDIKILNQFNGLVDKNTKSVKWSSG